MAATTSAYPDSIVKRDGSLAAFDHPACQLSVLLFFEGTDRLRSQNERNLFGEEDLLEKEDLLETAVPIDIGKAVSLGKVKDIVASDIETVKKDPSADPAVKTDADPEIVVVLLRSELLFDRSQAVKTAETFPDRESPENHDVIDLISRSGDVIEDIQKRIGKSFTALIARVKDQSGQSDFHNDPSSKAFQRINESKTNFSARAFYELKEMAFRYLRVSLAAYP